MGLLNLLGFEKGKEIYSTSRGFLLFVIGLTHLILVIYGVYFWATSSIILLRIAQVLIGLFTIYGILFFLRFNITTIYRFAIFSIHIAFFLHAFYTNGVFSPGISQLIIPSVLGFFYEKKYDKYVFLAMGVISTLLLIFLTSGGYVQNTLKSHVFFHTTFTYSIVFVVIAIFTVLLWSGLNSKNKELKRSIDKLEETTQKLIDSEKMASLGILSAGIAHEIKNPLNFINNGLALLKREENHQEENTLFKPIELGVEKINAIVKSLGYFSRSSESMEEACNIHEIIDNALTILNPTLKNKVVVNKAFSKEELIIKGNGGQLHQIITNLIANAEQAIEYKGEITIRTSTNANFTNIVITDNGSGISKENLKKIEEPFFTTKAPGIGTGLGLSITKKLVHDHKGYISFVSELGSHTEVTLRFPSKSN